MSQLSDLLAERQAIDAAIAAAKPEAVAEVQKLMGDLGLTVADLLPAKPARRAAVVPPKYRDPNGNTWSGRGLKPVWLRDAMAKGSTLDDFRV